MDTKTILLDSSILIDYFRKANKSKSVLYKLSEKYHFCLSTITVFEIKIGIKTEKQWNDYHILTRNLEILSIDESCIDETVNIYNALKKQNNLIELADLLIAATAISNSLPLATLNIKHFENISDLEIIPSFLP
ncbi:type II toxin-antitoxin system VapC family toxin [candidate division KSB1 bacterium]|nr:type II toxin-antitoxin system VapC family toxin [candidate division KSB1 bacterium]